MCWGNHIVCHVDPTFGYGNRDIGENPVILRTNPHTLNRTSGDLLQLETKKKTRDLKSKTHDKKYKKRRLLYFKKINDREDTNRKLYTSPLW